MTAPAPHGGQTNRERAAEDARRALAEFIARHSNHFWRAWTDEARAHAISEWEHLLVGEPLRSYIAAAEARGDATGYERGRAEAAAKIEGLAAELASALLPATGAYVARRLLVLAADLSVPGSQEPQP